MDVPGKLPPLPALRTFEAAARHLSYTRAAAELHVTHSAVSHQIRALEAHLGVALFNRQGRAMVLTSAGEELLLSANAALRQLSDTIAGLHRRVNVNRLAVSVMPSFAGRWLAPRIASFIEAHPGCEVNVLSTTKISDFTRDGVDVAIRWGFGGYSGVRSELLMDDVMFPVLSPRYSGVMPTRPAELAGLPLLRSSGEDWVPWFRAAGLDWPEPASGLMFDDSGMVVQAAIDGHGIALARRSLTALALRTGQLVRPFDIEVPVMYSAGQDVPVAAGLDEAGQPRRWRFWLILPQRDTDTPLQRAFIAWLRADVAIDTEPLPDQG